MDKFKIVRGVPGDSAMQSLAVKKDDYIIFRDMAKEAGINQVDLFKSMVCFCLKRFQVIDPQEDEE